jgi:hypothetical protein
MTERVLSKLEHAFAVGATDGEACFFAEIGKDVLYNYIKKSPEFHDRKEALKQKPVLLAKTNVIKKLQQEDIDTSKWYLERKSKEEFSTKTIGEVKIDNTISLILGDIHNKSKGIESPALDNNSDK